MNTKERIIYESLKLFSIHGFEAVSTRMIARAVGLSDAVLYKHFVSKQEIFTTCIEICKERFIAKKKSYDMEHMHWKDVERICLDVFHFQTEDEWIVMFRKVLVVEQYKNAKMAALYKDFFINYEVETLARLFEKLMEAEVMKKQNPRIPAMELYAPFFMYHTVEQKPEQLLTDLKEHVQNFCECNRIHKES